MSTSASTISAQKVESTLQSLELESLDVDSLFTALTAVEQAIPVLLSSIKPILSHLSSPTPPQQGDEGSDSNGMESGNGQEAKDAIGRYMEILDKIQFVLRQTVYYLHETKASSNTLRPPHPNSIPTPFASTLPSGNGREGGQVELGLYGRRIEARTLKDMITVLGKLEGELRSRRNSIGDDERDPKSGIGMEVDQTDEEVGTA